MIDLQRLPAAEAERMAYAEGFTGTAALFARIAELEHAASVLLDILDTQEGVIWMDVEREAIENMREVLK